MRKPRRNRAANHGTALISMRFSLAGFPGVPGCGFPLRKARVVRCPDMRRMIFALGVWLGVGLAVCRAEVAAPELVELPYRVVHDEMLFLRDKDDRRDSVWTDDPAKVPEVVGSFGLGFDDLLLKKGEVLTRVMYNKATRECFGDYACADIMLKIGPVPQGKKHSRLTVVVFSPPELPSHIGMREIVQGGLSAGVP